MTKTLLLAALMFACCVFTSAQTPKTFTKDNLSFDLSERLDVGGRQQRRRAADHADQAEQRCANQGLRAQGPHLAGQITGCEESVHRSVHHGDGEAVCSNGRNARADARHYRDRRSESGRCEYQGVVGWRSRGREDLLGGRGPARGGADALRSRPRNQTTGARLGSPAHQLKVKDPNAVGSPSPKPSPE